MNTNNKNNNKNNNNNNAKAAPAAAAAALTDEEFFALHPQPALVLTGGYHELVFPPYERQQGNNEWYNSATYFDDVGCLSGPESEGEGEEDEDEELYLRKRYPQPVKMAPLFEWFPTTFEENIPMDISDSEEEDEEAVQRSFSFDSNYELKPRKLFPELEDGEIDEDEEDEEAEEDEEEVAVAVVDLSFPPKPFKYQRQVAISLPDFPEDMNMDWEFDRIIIEAEGEDDVPELIVDIPRIGENELTVVINGWTYVRDASIERIVNK
jgi:hypothetical protein